MERSDQIIVFKNNNNFFITNFHEETYEVTALYNITVQTIERKNHRNQYNEQLLCMLTTTLKHFS